MLLASGRWSDIGCLGRYSSLVAEFPLAVRARIRVGWAHSYANRNDPDPNQIDYFVQRIIETAPDLLKHLDEHDVDAPRCMLESLVDFMRGMSRAMSLTGASADDVEPCRPSRKMYAARKIIKVLSLSRLVANSGTLKDVVQSSVSIVFESLSASTAPSAPPRELGPDVDN